MSHTIPLDIRVRLMKEIQEYLPGGALVDNGHYFWRPLGARGVDEIRIEVEQRRSDWYLTDKAWLAIDVHPNIHRRLKLVFKWKQVSPLDYKAIGYEFSDHAAILRKVREIEAILKEKS